MSDKDKKRYYWLKLKEDFFEEDTIQWLEEQDNGKEYSLIYLKLCLKSLKTDGVLVRNVGEMLLPYDEKSIAKMTNSNIDTVIIAMSLFKKIGLIEFLENGEMFLTQLEELVGNETYAAKRKRLERAKKNNVIEVSGQVRDNVAQSIEYRDKSIDTMSSSSAQDDVPYKEIVDYLNLKADKNYRHSGKKTKSLIKARCNEGFNLEDFKKVIDNKCFDWNVEGKEINGTPSSNYLRPETLFGNKFEAYLNENNLKANGSIQKVESSNKPKPVVIPADWIN